ncbi:MAG: T9SS type A sorting domain-containing protein [Bacteroidota bacterium]
MTNFPKAFLLLISLFVFTPINAAHITGGTIGYECIGNGIFKFTMKIYRDCAGTGSPFDNPAAISIYDDQVDLIYNLDVPLGTVEVLTENAEECYGTSSDFCLEEGIYTFQVNLSLLSSFYTIAYQRCCRIPGINNVVSPESTGITITTELTSLAMSQCNDSPEFNFTPPFVFCSSVDAQFPFPAIDTDGDSLVYAFCTPFSGGGFAGLGGNPGSQTDCDGVRPDPACPPPFTEIEFGPAFSGSNPLGGAPQVTIDPLTGTISGNIVVQGQYVAGICVTEFRNGQVIGTIRQDIQILVTNCPPQIEPNANIVQPTAIGANDGAITLTPQGGTPPYTYEWESGETTNNLSNLPPGSYMITVIDTENCFYVGTFQLDVNLNTSTFEEADITFFPNPAYSKFEIFIPPRILADEIRIRDLRGKIVYRQRITSGSNYEISLENLPQGLLIIELLEQNRIYNGKLLHFK